MTGQCPESKAIGELQATIKALEKNQSRVLLELEKLQSAILLNAEARIYHDGVNEGKRSTDKAPFNYLNKMVMMVGSGVLLLVVLLLIYVIAGAEHVTDFVKAIVGAFR